MPGESSSQEQSVQEQDAPAPDAEVLEGAKPQSEQSPDSDTPDAKAADSSAADDTDANEAETLLDVVAKAVKEESVSGESSGSKSGQDGQAEGEAKAEGEENAEAESELKDEELPFHKHPRWQEVQKELKELRPLKEKIEQYEPKAQALDQLVDFTEKSNLSSDEVNEGFAVMATMKNDPEKAISVLEGYLEKLKSAVGMTLPQDIQDQVNRGFITEEAGLEMSRSRSREARSSAAAEAARQHADAITKQTQSEQAQRDVISAIEKWDAQWKQSDPDYGKKIPFVKKEIAFQMSQRGDQAITPQEAVEIAKEAIKTVDKELKSLAPKKQAINPPSSDGSSAKTTAEPQTSRDAIAQAIANS